MVKVYNKLLNMSGDTEKNQFIFINFLFYNINLFLVKFVFTYNRTTFLPRYINLKSFQKHWKPQSVLSLCHECIGIAPQRR